MSPRASVDTDIQSPIVIGERNDKSESEIGIPGSEQLIIAAQPHFPSAEWMICLDPGVAFSFLQVILSFSVFDSIDHIRIYGTIST
jgi:hypothetical protein